VKHEKHVLITGANGFIGKQVSAVFKSHGWKVTRAVRKPAQADEIFLDLEDVSRAELSGLPKIDAIIHLAAKVDLGVVNLNTLLTANVAATRELAQLSKQHDAFFLFSSTALLDCYDFSSEKDSKSGSGFAYGRSKFLAEQALLNLDGSAAIFRICGVYGAYGPEHLGINKAIHALAHGSRPQQVATGRAKRNYLYVKDLAQMIYSATTRRLTGIHSVASSEVLTISDMLNILCLRFSPDSTVEVLEGQEAQDQIIHPSPLLHSRYSFKAAVDDIYADLLV
jgi:UDP-glucose 4-epimerase